MRANHVEDTDKPAFVGAVEAELNGLNAENCHACGADFAHLETWAATWNASLGIVGALQ
jgi:hypothetical protein